MYVLKYVQAHCMCKNVCACMHIHVEAKEQSWRLLLLRFHPVCSFEEKSLIGLELTVRLT